MRILLATDIFGETCQVGVLTAHLQERGYEVETVSPYARPRSFADEDEAYAIFLRECGVEAYTEKIRDTLEEMVGPLICIGFSAGAASLWRALAGPGAEIVETAILFYGSQIRNVAEWQPRCNTVLVCPATEPHFSIADLLVRLQDKPGIICAIVPWLHGFMNSLSDNFDQDGYRRTLAWLVWLLDQPDRLTEKEVFRRLLCRD